MVIKSELLYEGRLFRLEYRDCDSFDELPRELITQVYGVCFLGDQLLIVHNGKKDTWGFAGGTTEPGETIEQTLVREVREESNMRVISWQPIGYQIVTSPNGVVQYQLRVYCQIEKLGEFEGDPGGVVDKIELVSPNRVKRYFDWHEIGDRIVERALEIHASR
ncbi:MAG TPA: NUDIX domain-containing protein [Verrucomicrobiae bacterium]|nr:NUDIX domain-containing protein [Verrucomicrobiae bacterium]